MWLIRLNMSFMDTHIRKVEKKIIDIINSMITLIVYSFVDFVFFFDNNIISIIGNMPPRK